MCQSIIWNEWVNEDARRHYMPGQLLMIIITIAMFLNCGTLSYFFDQLCRKTKRVCRKTKRECCLPIASIHLW